MEFKVSSSELLKALSNVSRAIPAKAAISILENFLFVLNDDSLEITASDQELTLRTVVKVDSSVENGSIAVPARQIIELFKTLPDQPVVIRTTSDTSFECIWTNGNSSLPFFPAEDYPTIGAVGEDSINVSVPTDELAEGIGRTIYATADDEMRPQMNGIFFDIDPASTTLVASDSHKLICFTTNEFKTPQAASFILHKKAAAILKGSIDKEEGDVEITFDSSSAVFKFGTTMLVCRLVVGKYPKYREVIPLNNPNILKIDRNLLLGTVRRVAVCANKASNHIKVELKPGQVEITAQDLGFAIAAYEKIECDYAGAELSIGFKSSFLIEILNNMSCENLVMKFADARRAALIVPSEDEVENDKVCGILMPIMVS